MHSPLYSGGIWLDCGCVMCILKAGPSVGPNPVTGKGIVTTGKTKKVNHNPNTNKQPHLPEGSKVKSPNDLSPES
jgi:hypothetical protein